MRTTFINALTERARIDDRIFLITPDLGFSVVERFAEEFPDRFINVGVAEQNAVGVAAGLAMSGKIVYVYSIIPFVTMRCFEQIRVDVAYMNTNVRLVGVGAGLSYGPQGATHHSIEDISIMKSLPNMNVCCPGDPIEVKGVMEASFTTNGPFYIRLGKNGEPRLHGEETKLELGRSIKMMDGDDLAIISTSNTLEMCYDWASGLKSAGKNPMLISMPFIKPFDKETVKGLIDRNIPIISVEEHSEIGGLGTSIAEVIASSGKAVSFRKIALPDSYSHTVGSQSFLREKFGITPIDL